jgi:hypothetical protein
MALTAGQTVLCVALFALGHLTNAMEGPSRLFRREIQQRFKTIFRAASLGPREDA